MTEFLFVFITASSREEAEKIGQTLIDEKLAACVNIYPEVTSIYRWQEEISRESEVPVCAKTTAEKFATLRERVAEIHSYECPCILAVPIVDGYDPYLDWIRNSIA